MNCIQRIEQLLKEKGISRNKMSEDIGIGNSTFYTWQKRGFDPLRLHQIYKSREASNYRRSRDLYFSAFPY